MILPVLLGTYGVTTAYNVIVPIIKKEDAKKKTIKMFEDNGYDVDERYINILFKKYYIFKNLEEKTKITEEEKKYKLLCF